MITKEFKNRILYLKKNQLIFEALYEILEEFDLRHSSFNGFEFREEINPKGLLLTAEGTETTGITIKVPRNILDFDLALVANLLMHEMYHVFQRSGKNQVETREEREWQAYYEMIFHEKFPNIPPLSDFYCKQFANKALSYYQRMTEDLKLAYQHQKSQIDQVIETILQKEQPQPDEKETTIAWHDFEKIDMRVGTIIQVDDFPEALNPSYQLHIDFGPLGIKRSAAQITSLYSKEQLIHQQIIAVVNFSPKQIGKFMSECLVMGIYGNDKDVILLNPQRKVENGWKIG